MPFWRVSCRSLRWRPRQSLPDWYTPTPSKGKDYDEERVAWLWTKTGAEEWTICENNQVGVNSRMFESGPYSIQETSVADFVALYLREIGAAR